MTLRDDIRGHFDREAGRFPTPAGLRATVTDEAARGAAVQRRTTTWAAAVAVVLAVAIVAGLLAAGALRHSRVTPVVPGPKSILATPNPAGNVNIVEVDPVDSSVGWALLFSLPPGGGQRQFWVSSTGDGGASWSAPAKVGPQLGPTEGDSGHHIHFVDRNNGFVYGNSTAFVTHDGGRTWRDTGLHFLEVVSITGFGPVWAVIYPCAKGTQCPFEVLVSNDLGTTWTPTSALPGGFMPRDAVAFSVARGTDGLLLSGYGSGDMARTTDGGRTWTLIAGQCSPETFENFVATADGVQLWQYCGAEPPVASPPPSPPVEKLLVSTDGGATWERRTAVGGVTVGAILVAPMPGMAVLVTSSLLVSKDRGASWQAVTGAEGFNSIAFAQSADVGWPKDAWAASSSRTIWATHDGGLSWAPLPSSP